jgi:hypothetical protein
MLALFAAQQSAAAASGLAGGLLPAISASTLDGFAVGMLLSGGVFLLVTAHVQSPGRLGRMAIPGLAGDGAAELAGAAASADSAPIAQGCELGEYPFPAPVATTPAATFPAAIAPPAVTVPDTTAAVPPAVMMPAVAALTAAATSIASEQLLLAGDADAEAELVTPGEADEPGTERGAPRRASGYQSRHRQSGAEEPRPWPAADGRRHAPRHAAPASATLARRMSALVPVRLAAASHRAA